MTVSHTTTLTTAFSSALADQLVTAILVLDGQLKVHYANAAADAIFAASARRLEATPARQPPTLQQFRLVATEWRTAVATNNFR